MITVGTEGARCLGVSQYVSEQVRLTQGRQGYFDMCVGQCGGPFSCSGSVLYTRIAHMSAHGCLTLDRVDIITHTHTHPHTHTHTYTHTYYAAPCLTFDRVDNVSTDGIQSSNAAILPSAVDGVSRSRRPPIARLMNLRGGKEFRLK